MHVVGYYPLAGGQVYRPTKTLRLYDSRKDPAGTLVPGVDRMVTMPALSGIPATAMTGVMLNVTDGVADRHRHADRAVQRW